jgi:TPR repeat protein
MNGYLKAANTIDPDATGVYFRYFQYNTPRWGGNYANLEKLAEEARQAGKMSRRNLARLDADLLVWRAIDETGLNKNPAGASDYYIAAYNAAPGKENIRYLHWAAHQANEAKQADKAIAIYTRIISEDKDNTNAYFQRGYLYHTEKENYPMALKDYLVAAEMGNMSAQNNVGYYYMTGKAGTKDLKLAREYLNKSAAQGFEHAKEKLKLLDSMQP